MTTPLLADVVTLAEQAGALILGFYQRPHLAARDKTDGSPVTEADLAAEAFLRGELARRWLYPIISEETPAAPYEERRSWSRFWLVDPLDGTRDFVAETAEFCVNIALIEGDRPVLGVVHAPALGVTWCAARGGGARRIEAGTERRLRAEPQGVLIGLKSRFHSTPQVDRYFKDHGVKQNKAMGSTIKLCQIAEGLADVYVSWGGSKEWDIAPGQLIAEEAGAHVVVLGENTPLRYNRPDLQNPPLLACSQRFLTQISADD